IPLLLGCARPTGRSKSEIDSYAVMAGLNGIAHPADGMVELAVRMGRKVRVTPACCSIAVGDEVLALENDTSGIAIDPQHIIEQERRFNRLAGIKVVSAS
ncbi:MAG: radical SAM protein, partial [Pseudomonadota bacterium]